MNYASRSSSIAFDQKQLSVFSKNLLAEKKGSPKLTTGIELEDDVGPPSRSWLPGLRVAR